MGLLEHFYEHIKTGDLTVRNYKYRCEQIIITKLDEIPLNTVTTKKDYLIERFIDAENHEAFSFRVKDEILSMFPEHLNDSLTLINEMENLKTNAIVVIDSQSGKIFKIPNHEEIVTSWDNYKKGLADRFKFLKGTAGSNALKHLTDLEDKVIYEYDKFLDSLSMNPFYSIFFDKYLVSEDITEEEHNITYCSQLFPGKSFALDCNRSYGETEDNLLYIKVTGSLPETFRGDDDIRKQYDEKFKPLIQFGFTEYNIEYSKLLWIDSPGRSLNKAEYSVREEVVDNVTIEVNLKVRKLKSID